MAKRKPRKKKPPMQQQAKAPSQPAPDPRSVERQQAYRQVRCWPDAALRSECLPVTVFDEQLMLLAARMVRILLVVGGESISAGQLGVLQQVIAYRPPGQECVILVNPQILASGEETVTTIEECISLPGTQVPVERPQTIHLRFQGVDGDSEEMEVRGHHARVLQHEIDHLAGTTILQRTDQLSRRVAVNELWTLIGLDR